jgi:hypothetical protein
MHSPSSPNQVQSGDAQRTVGGGVAVVKKEVMSDTGIKTSFDVGSSGKCNLRRKAIKWLPKSVHDLHASKFEFE